MLISGGTLAEALIVGRRRGVQPGIERLVDELGLEIVTVTPAMARHVAQAYDRWGKGVHPASLTFGDCFAYVLAKERGCRLLSIGNDFAKTDIESVL